MGETTGISLNADKNEKTDLRVRGLMANETGLIDVYKTESSFDIPIEIREFLSRCLLEHSKRIPIEQLIEQFHMGINMKMDRLTIETVTSNYDKSKNFLGMFSGD